MSSRDRFDFETSPDHGVLGLLRSFRAMMEQATDQDGTNRGTRSFDESTYGSSLYQPEPMGIIGRLQELQQAQSGYQPKQPAMVPQKYELAQAITNASRNLGIDPHDLATAISYETGGTFNHNLWGGSGGKYLGLIQFGPEEQTKYGVKEGQSITEQMRAVEKFLRDRGLTPGSGLLDIYSTINTGSPGHYGLSDAGKGGAPGTVKDKVNTQMGGHMNKAAVLLKQYDAVRPRYSVPGPFPQQAQPIFPRPPGVSPTGRRAGDPSVPTSSRADAGLANQQGPEVRSPLGLVSGKPMQFLPVPVFDMRQ
ncbi:hypothetical protein ACVINW_004884 [Bradyrhizobium sp. USDA 4461]